MLLSVSLSAIYTQHSTALLALWLCDMDFSVTDLHKTEKELNLALKQVLKTNKIYSIDEMNESTLMKLNKETLAGYVKNLAKLLNNNYVNLLQEELTS